MEKEQKEPSLNWNGLCTESRCNNAKLFLNTHTQSYKQAACKRENFTQGVFFKQQHTRIKRQGKDDNLPLEKQIRDAVISQIKMHEEATIDSDSLQLTYAIQTVTRKAKYLNGKVNINLNIAAEPRS